MLFEKFDLLKIMQRCKFLIYIYIVIILIVLLLSKLLPGTDRFMKSFSLRKYFQKLRKNERTTQKNKYIRFIKKKINFKILLILSENHNIGE